MNDCRLRVSCVVPVSSCNCSHEHQADMVDVEVRVQCQYGGESHHNTDYSSTKIFNSENPVKRKRGRPRKNPEIKPSQPVRVQICVGKVVRKAQELGLLKKKLSERHSTAEFTKFSSKSVTSPPPFDFLNWPTPAVQESTVTSTVSLEPRCVPPARAQTERPQKWRPPTPVPKRLSSPDMDWEKDSISTHSYASVEIEYIPPRPPIMRTEKKVKDKPEKIKKTKIPKMAKSIPKNDHDLADELTYEEVRQMFEWAAPARVLSGNSTCHGRLAARMECEDRESMFAKYVDGHIYSIKKFYPELKRIVGRIFDVAGNRLVWWVDWKDSRHSKQNLVLDALLKSHEPYYLKLIDFLEKNCVVPSLPATRQTRSGDVELDVAGCDEDMLLAFFGDCENMDEVNPCRSVVPVSSLQSKKLSRRNDYKSMLSPEIPRRYAPVDSLNLSADFFYHPVINPDLDRYHPCILPWESPVPDEVISDHKFDVIEEETDGCADDLYYVHVDTSESEDVWWCPPVRVS